MISNDENVAMVIEAWKLMTSRFEGSDFQHGSGVASTFANLPLPFLNISFQETPAAGEADLRSTLSQMRQRATACPHHSLIGLCDEWVPERWQAIAEEEGFAFMINMTGMAANELLPIRRPLPQLEFRRVLDDAIARDLAIINTHAYGMPTDLWECMYNMQLWHQDSYGYVAYIDGKAVSTASALPVDGTMYIALVATLPEMHGNGYAEAVMRHAIEQGQAGMGKRRIVLHASDMGHPLYRSMGFTAGSKIPLFSAA